MKISPEGVVFTGIALAAHAAALVFLAGRIGFPESGAAPGTAVVMLRTMPTDLSRQVADWDRRPWALIALSSHAPPAVGFPPSLPPNETELSRGSRPGPLSAVASAYLSIADRDGPPERPHTVSTPKSARAPVDEPVPAVQFSAVRPRLPATPTMLPAPSPSG